jgi:hypothetical protein
MDRGAAAGLTKGNSRILGLRPSIPAAHQFLDHLGLACFTKSGKDSCHLAVGAVPSHFPIRELWESVGVATGFNSQLIEGSAASVISSVWILPRREISSRTLLPAPS